MTELKYVNLFYRGVLGWPLKCQSPERPFVLRHGDERFASLDKK